MKVYVWFLKYFLNLLKVSWIVSLGGDYFVNFSVKLNYIIIS